jgi:hypothetical protein
VKVVAADGRVKEHRNPEAGFVFPGDRRYRGYNLSWRAGLGAAANRILRLFDIELVPRISSRKQLTQLGQQPRVATPTEPFSAPFLKGFRGRSIKSLQQPADFAVVMTTTLRSTIANAVQSIFHQRFAGSVQILIGIDASIGDATRAEQLCLSLPDRHSVLLFYPGYSTSFRHGGLHAARDGGSLRTILSYLANSRYVAYLDDDNWWSEDHLSALYSVLSGGAEWAYTLRWFVHPDSRRPICRDDWESVGPGGGHFSKAGGWVDPNCLAIDKIACEATLPWWSIPMRNSPEGMDADRNVFRILRTRFRGASTGRHSVFYQINEADIMHPYRVSVIGEQRYQSSGEELPQI